MGISQPGNTIEEVYLKYQKDIFAKTIWGHLFDENVKYEDKDIFEKTEIYLRDFFISQGFEWNADNRAKIYSLVINSDNAKLIVDYFQKNYEQCLVEPLEWTPDSSIQHMVNQLIDSSIQKNKKLSYEYAKRLLVKYYYAKFAESNEKEKIITHVITIFFMNKDMQRLSVETKSNLDALIGTAYHKITKLLGVKIEPKLFIRKFVLLKSFHICLQNNLQLREQLASSQYAFVYNDLFEEISGKISNLPVKEVQQQPLAKREVKEEKTEKDATDKVSKDIKQKTDTVTKVASKETETKETQENLKPPKKEDAKLCEPDACETPIDVFLKKIGGKNLSKEDIVSALLNDAKGTIEKIDMHNIVYESYSVISSNDNLVDVEIEELKY